uniref:Uncharacterized protein n=1 Tax=Anopheles culicifacies TaxID=139723 RepID=A0A182M6B2_9DIPT
MRCNNVSWSHFVILLIIAIVLVETKRFRILDERPDYKRLVETISDRLDEQIYDFAPVCAVVLLIATVVSAASSESESGIDPAVESKSYFGYHPKPKDSYKKLVEEVDEWTRLNHEALLALGEKIETLHKKLYHRKDKEHGGGYYYNDMEQMQKLLREQKAALDSLRGERPAA